VLLLPAILVAEVLLQLTPVVYAADQVSVSLNDGTTGATYTGFNGNATNPNAQNLTAIGATDWRIWGTAVSATPLAGNARKSGGSGISSLGDIQQASPIALRALGPLGLSVGNGSSTLPFSFSWTDGAAPVSATATKGGLQHNAPSGGSVGYGFRLTVPASATSQRLTLWVSSHHGTGLLTATVGSTVQTNAGVTGGQNHGGVYSIDFSGDGIEEFLEVTFVLDSLSPSPDEVGLPSTEANVVVYAAALSPTPGAAIAAPVLYQAIPDGEGQALISGRLSGTPSTTYEVTVKTAGTCTDGILGGEPSTVGTFATSTNLVGDSQFGGSVPIGSGLQAFVTGEVSGPGSVTSAPSPCIVANEDNDTWPRAHPISLIEGGGSATGHIDDAGRARWFKVAIQPGQRLVVNLSDLPADFDMFVFRDIAQTYASLTGSTDLTRLSAEFAPSAFSPSAFSPSAFSPSAFSPDEFAPSAFSPSAFSLSVYSPSAFSPSAFSPSAFSPSAFSPSAFSPSAFSPSAFSPSAFSPSAFSPSAFSADTYASAQIRSLITGSGAAGLADESITVDTWNNTGDFYIRVNGKNGASSLEPFSLGVTVVGSACDGVLPVDSDDFAAPAGLYKTLILTDLSRMDETLPGNAAADKATLEGDLTTFAARPEILGAVVDVDDHARVHALNVQADASTSCMYAKNLVASSIRDIVKAYKATNPGLKYVVIVGGDDAIPFFRYPDQALLGPESAFLAPVLGGTASDASLRSNYVLGQDAYGASIDLSVRASTFPIPDLPVGRLVETAAEASGMIDAYALTSGGTVSAPTSALVTGYDFLEDAARAVSTDLGAGMGTAGTVEELISGSAVAPQTLCTSTTTLPNCSWNAGALQGGLLDSRHDLVYLAGHFSANSTLAADFATTMLATELDASSVNLVNSIVFSAGCHSGYNVVDPDALTGGSVDWAQAFARKQATLIAGTGYQYGDTDFLEYSERIYAEFAHQLRIGTGPVSVGDALARSKQIYLATTPDIRGLHEKALLEATLFGLPMLSVNLPAGRLPAPTAGSVVGSTTSFTVNPGLALGLRWHDLGITPALDDHTVDLTSVGGPVTATYYSGSDGVVTNPGEPALPLESRDVTVTGKVLRGVGFRGGTYSDQIVTPLTGAPAHPEEQIRGVHPGFASPVFYPMRLWTPNYFDALTGGPTRLLVTPAQHRATGDAATLRLYSGLDLRLYFSDYTGAAAISGGPTISGVTTEVVGTNVTFRAHVVGDPQAGIQQVWITHTGSANAWTSLDLEQNGTDSTLWSKTIPLPTPLAGRAVEFIIQAVNGVGLLTLDDNLGRYYALGKAGQTISFAALPGKTFLDADFSVNASSSSGLPVTFSAIASCTVTGSTVHITGAGSCTITASQAGNSDFYAATDVSRTFLIARASQMIAIAQPPPKTFGDPDFPVTATSTSGLPVTLTASGSCTITGTTVHINAVGPCTISGTQAGNFNYTPAAPVSIPVTVFWPFTGFFSPVDNVPVLNTANAGSAIPVKFSLGANRGLNILAAGSPVAVKFICGTAPTDAIEEVSTATSSGLQYDAATGQYKYTWKTPKTYAGSCYQLRVTLIDGSIQVANFKFK
jgi:hypothetical protein